MEYEETETNANTNTAAVAQEIANNLTAAPPKKPNPIKALCEKLGKSPLFIGKRKFISLPLVGLALAAIIIVPIIIINANRPPLNPLHDPAFISWVEDYAGRLQSVIDEHDGDIDVAIGFIDNLLATETNPPRRRILLNDKATLNSSGDRLDEAIASIEEYIEIADDIDASREAGIRHLADLYYAKGDLPRALELFRQALDIAVETLHYQGNDYYVEMIEQIESELNGAENE
jgi:tetratricopeptide (TPR) repeat protein